MTCVARLSAAVLGAGLLVSPAAAQDQGEIKLSCINAGNRYAVGEFACIAACHQQRRLARCDMVLNNTSWTYVSDTCPSAMIINPPWPSDWSEVPAESAMSPLPVTVTYSAFPPEMQLALAALRD
jgi:hypothetical protein